MERLPSCPVKRISWILFGKSQTRSSTRPFARSPASCKLPRYLKQVLSFKSTEDFLVLSVSLTSTNSTIARAISRFKRAGSNASRRTASGGSDLGHSHSAEPSTEDKPTEESEKIPQDQSLVESPRDFNDEGFTGFSHQLTRKASSSFKGLADYAVSVTPGPIREIVRAGVNRMDSIGSVFSTDMSESSGSVAAGTSTSGITRDHHPILPEIRTHYADSPGSSGVMLSPEPADGDASKQTGEEDSEDSFLSKIPGFFDFGREMKQRLSEFSKLALGNTSNPSSENGDDSPSRSFSNYSPSADSSSTSDRKSKSQSASSVVVTPNQATGKPGELVETSKDHIEIRNSKGQLHPKMLDLDSHPVVSSPLSEGLPAPTEAGEAYVGKRDSPMMGQKGFPASEDPKSGQEDEMKPPPPRRQNDVLVKKDDFN